ncbi:Uma2 family endonuclease [Hymenobacter ginsengisoli]|uniref:Uma2 family endonuclease n=1 Tax=Hymenobacter ginsengisoli TaxID=1051626 RepID=A0ABP8Q5D8_9BACT|nr:MULTISPECIES: Uma2 family endonuclease [unclassified Hymenobacter]MBO2033603.1 Uma2 family endonuclease [Hymenobacter sp. BT559]
MLSDAEKNYLAAERLAPTRSEYLDGQVFPLPDATPEQLLIAENTALLLASQVAGRGWAVLGPGTRLHALGAGLFTYPDVALVGGKVLRLADAHRDTLLNPTLLVKVLPHPMPPHFQEIFEAYYAIPTVQHVVLITEYAARVSLGSRTEEGSLEVQGFTGLAAVLTIPDLELALPLAEIYHGVALRA